MHNSPTLSALHNSPNLNTAQNQQTLNTMHNSLTFNTLPNLIYYSPPFSFMHNSQPIRTQSFQNLPILITTLNASPLNTRTVHNLPTINLMQNPSNSRVSQNSLPFNQAQISHHYNQENKSYKRIKSKIDESKVFRYYNKHGLNQTKVHFHIGFDRLKKILKNKGKNHNKRKTNVEIDDFIVELASSGRQAFAISVEIEKRFQKHISRQTVIRRLKENHFKYRKLFKVPELSESQILLKYNFSSLLFINNFDFNEEMKQDFLLDLITKNGRYKMMICRLMRQRKFVNIHIVFLFGLQSAIILNLNLFLSTKELTKNVIKRSSNNQKYLKISIK